jgi:hypothetical protein
VRTVQASKVFEIFNEEEDCVGVLIKQVSGIPAEVSKGIPPPFFCSGNVWNVAHHKFI